MDYIKDQVYFVLYFINIFILIKWSATVHAGVLHFFGKLFQLVQIHPKWFIWKNN